MKKILLLMATICAGLAAMAQGGTVLLTGMTSKPCIVREWENGYSLLCVYDSTGNDCLVLERQGDAYYQRVTLPTGMAVADMRVLNGHAYLCGSTSGNDGWVGEFDIQDLLSGNLTLDVALLNDPGKKVMADRLVPFDVGSHVEVAFVGHEMAGSAFYRALVGGACLASPRAWQIKFQPLGNGNIVLSDVCATENYVVTAGAIGNRSFSQVFYKVGGFPGPELVPSTLFASTDLTATSSPMLVALPGDRFAWAVTYDDGLGSKGSRLSAWDVDGSLLTVSPAWSEALHQTQQASAGWRIGELAYQLADSSVYLLQQMDVASGSSESVVLRLPTGTMGIPAQGVFYHDALLLSMDHFADLGDCAQAVGQRSLADHTPMILRERPTGNCSCASNESFQVFPYQECLDTKDGTMGGQQTSSFFSLSFSVSKVMKMTLCGE